MAKSTSEERRDAARLRRHYPSARGRAAGDRAVDALPDDAPMHVFVDTWRAAYKKTTRAKHP